MNTDPAAAPKHRARKRFGQHFLTDPYVVAGIVAAISPQREDHLVEIGPGLGVLTESLLPCVNAMDAIELDRDIIPKLKEHCRDRGQLHIHEADALKFDFTTLAENGRPLRIVGNLPYNISTPLMFHLLSMHKQIQDMHFMLQKEVVDRLAAIPGNKDYGRLSVMMQYHCRVESLMQVPPEAFSPPPKVNSAVVRLVPYSEPPVNVDNVNLLEKLVTQAFSQRRKTLRNTLKPLMNAEQIEAQGVDPKRRAETLSLSEFATLTNFVSANSVRKENKAD
ncbi:MAG: 16S rRNA (adenine(1518)-N(6)/adenine(1519)-N(6))-dimethyltransferase RsmA [Gammaproteobacteria bacterium]|nr:16S rRNA (adenine(1518)-N(6)/adenine(1519)-N(6))-dimethyltransferase RsmA [Gammaproteobacteria bacterium]MCF6260584.1 16S rRNA (adenine(1518)-N(6)/adenine(1519)-N(6))-dimethyltransferase RsmA [Gammaproteobacteria bacterium]